MNWKKPVYLFQKYLKSFKDVILGIHGKIKSLWKNRNFKKQEIQQYSSQISSKGKALFQKVKGAKLENYKNYLHSWKVRDFQQKLHIPLFKKIIEKLNFPNNKALYLYSLAISICSYLIATLFTVSIDALLPDFPPSPKNIYNQFTETKDMSQYEIIIARNLFNKNGIIPDMSAIREDLPAVKTNLPFTLLGVILLEDKVKSIASVLNRTENAVVTVRVKEAIDRNTDVKEILKSKVLFYNKNTQQVEYIELPKIKQPISLKTNQPKKASPNGIKEVSKDHLTIERSEIESILSNMNEVITQARCVPSSEGGRNIGFKCVQIVPGSIYDRIGIKNNDIVISINEERLSNPGKALQVLRGLRDRERIQVTLKRNGKIITKKYDIL